MGGTNTKIKRKLGSKSKEKKDTKISSNLLLSTYLALQEWSLLNGLMIPKEIFSIIVGFMKLFPIPPTTDLLKILVIGPGGAGKSSFTHRFTTNTFVDDFDPTMQDLYRKKCIMDNSDVSIEIMDAAWQDEYNVALDWFIRVCDGIILIFDITRELDLRDLDHYKNQVIRGKDSQNIPIVLVGNKCDLINERQICCSFEARQYAGPNIKFFETSAKDDINVYEVFHEIVCEIYRLKQISD